MRKRRCPGGVKVAGFPGMSEVSGSINSCVRTLFSIDLCCIYLCLLCYSSLLSASTVTRGAPSTASFLTHS